MTIKDEIFTWGSIEASLFHIMESMKQYASNSSNFTWHDFLSQESITHHELLDTVKKHPLLLQVYEESNKKLVANFHKLCLMSDVNVQYGLAIAPLIDPEYKAWLLEYKAKEASAKAASLREITEYMKQAAKDDS